MGGCGAGYGDLEVEVGTRARRERALRDGGKHIGREVDVGVGRSPVEGGGHIGGERVAGVAYAGAHLELVGAYVYLVAVEADHSPREGCNGEHGGAVYGGGPLNEYGGDG
jgi:hypothetical protein